MNNLTLNDCISDCKIAEMAMGQAFKKLFQLKQLRHADKANFQALQTGMDDYAKSFIEPICFYWEHGELSDDDRLELGRHLGHLQNYFDTQKSQLINNATANDSSEGDGDAYTYNDI